MQYIFTILSTQYALDIDPGLRMNADYVFVFNDIDRNSRKRLYENFFGIFPSQSAFDKVMDVCTEDYRCLVLHRRSPSNKIEDRVFWYKARDRGNFRVGSPAFWKYHMINFDPDASEDSESLVPVNSKTKGLRVIMKNAS